MPSPSKNVVTSPNVEEGFSPPKDEAYLVHKLGSQTLTGGIKAVVNALRSVSEYRAYLSKYVLNPTDPVFGSPNLSLYNPNSPLGSSLRWALVPDPLKKLTTEDAQALRTDYAARSGRFQMQLFKSANAVEFSLNFASLAYGIFGDEKMEVEEGFVASLRMITSGSNFVGAHFKANAFKMISNTAKQTDEAVRTTLRRGAYQNLRWARQVSIAMNILQTVGGLVKMGIETKNALVDPDEFSVPAFTDGAMNAASGTAAAACNIYIARAAAMKAANTATLELAIDVHWLQAVSIPLRVVLPVVGLGLTTSAVSAAPNSRMIFEGIANDDLPDDTRQELIFSGMMGVASAISFAVYYIYMLPMAAVVVPAATVIAPAALAVGLALLAAQTMYVDWEGVVYAHEQLVDGTVTAIEYTVDGVASAHEAAVDGTVSAIEFVVDGADSAYEAASDWIVDIFGVPEMFSL